MRKTMLLICLALLALPVAAEAIVGGHPPTRPYPHMGALYFDDEFLCGSSLVRPDWVLTAAHCVEGSDATRYSVLLGTTKRSEGGERVPATAAVVNHEGHDLALLRLARPVTYAPIRVARPEETALYAPRTEAIAIGWGARDYLFDTEPTDDLQQIEIPIRSDPECQIAVIADDQGDAYNPRTMVCAGEDTGGEDTCQGDSGGPLMVDSGGALVLIGAVSFGNGCAYPTQHGVYARTATAFEWIESVVGPAAAAPAPAPGGPGAGPGTPPGGTPQEQRVQITLPARLGSARRARRSGRVAFGIRASGPVSDVRVTLKRGRRLLGRSRLSRVVGEALVRVRVNRPRVRAGRVSVTVTARDGQNRGVRAARRARLTR